MNKWVIRFDNNDNEYKAVINGGTIEDETHSRLFLEDWRKLYIDDKLNWKASDVIYWLFISQKMECFRKFGIDFMRLCVDDGGDQYFVMLIPSQEKLAVIYSFQKLVLLLIRLPIN